MKRKLLLILIPFTLFVFLISTFTVHQTKQALILRFGEVARTKITAGLGFKIPFVENVIYLDKRIMDLDISEAEFADSEQKKILINAYAKYRVINPLEFYKSVRNEFELRRKLEPVISSNLRVVIGRNKLNSLLTTKRAEMMEEVKLLVKNGADTYGIEIVDIRILRAELPVANRHSVYNRMRSDREKEAETIRASGRKLAQEIRANADKDSTVLIAEANKKSQILRGEGDAKAIKIFAKAFSRDVEFFKFYRSMEAYKKSLSGNNTSIVISPESEFFKYLK